MSTRPDSPLVKSLWSSTTATRTVSPSPLLKDLAPLFIYGPPWRSLYSLPAERAIGEAGGDLESPSSLQHRPRPRRLHREFGSAAAGSSRLGHPSRFPR